MRKLGSLVIAVAIRSAPTKALGTLESSAFTSNNNGKCNDGQIHTERFSELQGFGKSEILEYDGDLFGKSVKK